MKDLAPDILRQRLLIEGRYSILVDEDTVERFLLDLAAHLELRVYGKPIVHSPGGEGSPENQGFDAFIPLIDSGISLYVWSEARFFSVVLFTCKQFDESEAGVAFTRSFFDVDAIEWSSF